MKKFIKSIILVLVLTFIITSCETVEDVNMDRSTKPTVGFENSTVELNENGSAVITITTESPSTVPLIFKLIQVGGNAVDGKDFTFDQDLDNEPNYYSAADYGPIGGKIVIPAYATTGSLTIHGFTDFAEDSNSATFELEAMESMNGFAGANNKVTVNIQDYVEDDLTVVLNWNVNEGAVDSDGDAVESCAQDLDLYLGNATDADLAHSWNDCPESVSLSASNPDGEYFIHVEYWAPSGVTVDPADPLSYDTTFSLTVGQVGVSSQEIAGTTSSSNYLNWSAYAQYGGNGMHPNVIKITKTGTSYVIE